MSADRIACLPAPSTLATPGVFARLWAAASEAMERHRARRLIAEMEARMLRDIGIVRVEVEQVIRHGRQDTKRALPWWRT